MRLSRAMKGTAMTRRRRLPLFALMLTVASGALLSAASPLFAANQVVTNLNDNVAARHLRRHTPPHV